MNTTAALDALRALGQENRLAAYRALVRIGPAGIPVGMLQRRLKVSAPTLTAQLNVLRAAGLVTDRREGRVIRISADYQRMSALIEFLSENCCAEDPCPPGAAACTPKRKEPTP